MGRNLKRFVALPGLGLSWVPYLTPVTLLTLPFIVRLARTFTASPDKATTFIEAVKRNVVLAVTMLIGMGAGIFFNC